MYVKLSALLCGNPLVFWICMSINCILLYKMVSVLNVCRG